MFPFSHRQQALCLSMVKQAFEKPKSPSPSCANGQFNHHFPLPLSAHFKWHHHQTCKHLPIWLPRDDVTLYLGSGACARPRSVFVYMCTCAHVKGNSQGRYSMIRPQWSTRVICSAWGLPGATSTISHLPFSIYPCDKHHNPTTVAEAVWE